MAHDEISTVETMDLTGHPVLDFVNTGSRLRERYADLAAAEAAGYGPFGDRVHGYEDLVTWAERAGVVEAGMAARLRAAARTDPSPAAAALAEAKRMREALYRILSALERGDSAPKQDLAVVQERARAAEVHRELVCADGGCALAWPDTADLERVLWPLAAEAVDLLLSPDVARVKQCASEECNWLFWDASKNRSRRWCEMSACGNREKARRYQRRHASP